MKWEYLASPQGMSSLLQENEKGGRLWVLKSNAHRGQGVTVLPQQQAFRAALRTNFQEDVLLSWCRSTKLSNTQLLAGSST